LGVGASDGVHNQASCHSWCFDSDALKGILWDSAVMNSEGLEIPMGPRK
jgi:hypothetical protein